MKKTVIILLLLPALVIISGITMFGPQIIVTLVVALLGTVYFAVNRSAYAFIFCGFPLLFALLSAPIGMIEIPGYENTLSFILSVIIGAVGLIFVAVGLWKVLPCKKIERHSSVK